MFVILELSILAALIATWCFIDAAQHWDDKCW